jgi:glycine C-acetyltransferase/8-amino-7-oxononanoate synthase
MAMAIAAINLVVQEPERRHRLWENCRLLFEGLKKLGLSSTALQSPILPLIIGDAQRCMQFSQQLLGRGIFVQGIRPPTVPPGTSRLRIAVMATHERGHIEKALEVFQEIKDQDAGRLPHAETTRS